MREWASERMLEYIFHEASHNKQIHNRAERVQRVCSESKFFVECHIRCVFGVQVCVDAIAIVIIVGTCAWVVFYVHVSNRKKTVSCTTALLLQRFPSCFYFLKSNFKMKNTSDRDRECREKEYDESSWKVFARIKDLLFDLRVCFWKYIQMFIQQLSSLVVRVQNKTSV